MKERILAILLTICMLMSILPMGVFATDVDETWNQVEDDDQIISLASVEASGTCGTNVSWTLDSDGNLSITGSGAMWNYFPYLNDAPWYSYCSSVKTVTIANGVTSIGDYAFYCCDSLTSVSIPDSVTSIGEAAFEYCENLSSVTIGNGVTSIGDWAFEGCESLTELIVDEKNAYYCSEDGVLFNKDKTTLLCYPRGKIGAYTIPDSVTYIGDYAFYYCSSLTGVTIGNSVTDIGNHAFYKCSSLTDVTIPDSVTSIGIEAFHGCSSLTSVTIGNSVTSIGKYAFYGCSSLTNVTIPESVTTIGDSAFENCSSLTSVTIPYGITSIDFETFFGCSSLTSVTIPNSVTSIGDYAFYGCSSLTSVNIPDSVTSIGSYAFYWCSSLTSVTIGNRVTSIGETAFAYCSSLTSVTIPDSVTSIGNSAFRGCSSLTDVYYRGSEAQWQTISIGDYNDPLRNATIHYNYQGKDPANPFSDIAPGKFYYQPVLWAVEKGITNGLTATTFVPNETCTRGQVVTFLWRAAGKPEPKSNNNPFTDVIAGKYYYKAVLWAVENGITSGMTKTTFEPNSPCTRGQVVTFQWRAAGKPEPKSTNNPFTDVPAGKFYSKAVLWAVENGITSGMTKTTFVPDNVCTRGQIVTFLYRQYS